MMNAILLQGEKEASHDIIYDSNYPRLNNTFTNIEGAHLGLTLEVDQLQLQW